MQDKVVTTIEQLTQKDPITGFSSAEIFEAARADGSLAQLRTASKLRTTTNVSRCKAVLAVVPSGVEMGTRAWTWRVMASCQTCSAQPLPHPC